MMISDYYRFRLHENELQSSIRTKTGFGRLAPPLGVASLCPSHCRPRVSQSIRAILTYRGPLLPLTYRQRSLTSAETNKWFRGNIRCGSRSLPDLTGHFTARADGGHAAPLSASGKLFKLTVILLSALVGFSAFDLIKPQPPPVVVLPRQFL